MDTEWIEKIEMPVLIIFDSCTEANVASCELHQAGLISKEGFFREDYREPPYCIYIGSKGNWFWTAMSYFADNPDSQHTYEAMSARRYSYADLCRPSDNTPEVLDLFYRLLENTAEVI